MECRTISYAWWRNANDDLTVSRVYDELLSLVPIKMASWRLLTLSTASTTLERPAWTATVLMVVVEGGKSVSSLESV